MNIWANHLNNLTDARYFAAWNAAYISFQLDPNANAFIAPNVAEGIRGWVEGPRIVGSFGLAQTPDEVRATAQLLRLDAVQVSHFYDISALSDVAIVMEIAIDEHTSTNELDAILSRNAPFIDSFVFNFTKNNLTLSQMQYGEPMDWGYLCDTFSQYPIWLYFNIKPENIVALNALPIQGIVLQGGEEERVGVKAFDELDEILEAIEDIL
jgi:phosphoribosylanthranilate isomerase